MSDRTVEKEAKFTASLVKKEDESCRDELMEGMQTGALAVGFAERLEERAASLWWKRSGSSQLHLSSSGLL
ncbi:hypothetical protein Y1Q_0020152 [Alligator mississippiensis]|uniref:Uncharacterized protein n=1 Tax=Alligator mississippiensis TaxID=8496 RepID=A0A151NFN8_ALLMI|nr:hypothetical protein Y1Q_0020152 [Alligator mississippiensis]